MATKKAVSKAAQELGRRGGLKGGAARAASMTSEQRSSVAKRAAAARWNKEYPLPPPGHDVHHDGPALECVVPEGTSIAAAGTYTPAALAAEVTRWHPTHRWTWNESTQLFDVEPKR